MGALECCYSRARRDVIGAPLTPPPQKPHWHADLALSFAHAAGRTWLAGKSHQGPLQIQKTLYPEGPAICHVAVLHPPGGIADGDRLTVAARLGSGAKVCLTTPGASKWYRCQYGEAEQRLKFSLGTGAALEWLPRENILFDASRVRMDLDVELEDGAQFLGWEILCFGRRASQERWQRGALQLNSNVIRAGRPLWCERASVSADGGFDASPIGLAGFSVSATLVCAGADIDPELLRACRDTEPSPTDSRAAVTSLPGMLVARYLGHSSQEAMQWFTSVWQLLRPALLGVTATAPRLWAC